jgi:hypothetical protein
MNFGLPGNTSFIYEKLKVEISNGEWYHNKQIALCFDRMNKIY